MVAIFFREMYELGAAFNVLWQSEDNLKWVILPRFDTLVALDKLSFRQQRDWIPSIRSTYGLYPVAYQCVKSIDNQIKFVLKAETTQYHLAKFTSV